MSMFKRATKEKLKLRLGLCGPSGAGKSYTALRIGMELAKATNTKVAVIDSERGSASLYTGEVQDGNTFEFDTVDLSSMRGMYRPGNYIAAIEEAAKLGYGVIIIDSLSHAWAGEGGVLQLVEDKQKGIKNKWSAWREGGDIQNKLVDTLLGVDAHVIATLRTKMEHIQDGNRIKKVGMKSIQRDGIEYEFTVVCDIEQDTHICSVSKTRCASIDKMVYRPAGAELAQTLLKWLNSGAEPAPKEPTPEDEPDEPTPKAKAKAKTPPGPWAPRPPTSNEKVWKDNDKKRFMAELGKAKLKYDHLAEYCEGKQWPRPSVMFDEDREKVLKLAVKHAEKINKWERKPVDAEAYEKYEEGISALGFRVGELNDFFRSILRPMPWTLDAKKLEWFVAAFDEGGALREKVLAFTLPPQAPAEE